MYRIRPYTQDFSVEPARIMYNLPSYHQKILNDYEQLEKDVTANCLNSTSNQNGLEQKKIVDEECKLPPEEITNRLLLLSKRLDKFIAKQKTQIKDDKGKCNTGTKQEQCQQDLSINAKVNKKTDRTTPVKATTAAANPGEKTNSEKENKTKDANEERLEKSQHQIKLDSVNSPDLVHARIQPTAPIFPIHDYGSTALLNSHAKQNIQLQLRDSDQTWVNLFNQIGEQRGVQLISNKSSKTEAGNKLQIDAKYGYSEVRLTAASNIELTGEMPIFKFLGTLLGLYSPEDTEVSAKIDKWLLTGLDNIADLDSLSRKMNAFLATHDFLSSDYAICLADVMLRSFFSNKDGDLTPWREVKAANNVQLWVKRIDDALMNC